MRPACPPPAPRTPSSRRMPLFAVRPPSLLPRRLALLSLVALFSLAAGCSDKSDKSGDPPKFTDKEKWVIEIARRAVAQNEDWEPRAEYRIKRDNNLWHVSAWRVEHPEAKGNMRYVPWGHREVYLDDAGKVVRYGSKR